MDQTAEVDPGSETFICKFKKTRLSGLCPDEREVEDLMRRLSGLRKRAPRSAPETAGYRPQAIADRGALAAVITIGSQQR